MSLSRACDTTVDLCSLRRQSRIPAGPNEPCTNGSRDRLLIDVTHPLVARSGLPPRIAVPVVLPPHEALAPRPCRPRPPPTPRRRRPRRRRRRRRPRRRPSSRRRCPRPWPPPLPPTGPARARSPTLSIPPWSPTRCSCSRGGYPATRCSCSAHGRRSRAASRARPGGWAGAASPPTSPHLHPHCPRHPQRRRRTPLSSGGAPASPRGTARSTFSELSRIIRNTERICPVFAKL